MKLLWILYKGKKTTRYLLFLNLGNRNGKLVGLDTSKIDNTSRAKMMGSRDFQNLSLDAKIMWLKRHCPNAMAKAYRELYESNIKSRKEYKIE